MFSYHSNILSFFSFNKSESQYEFFPQYELDAWLTHLPFFGSFLRVRAFNEIRKKGDYLKTSFLHG